MNTEKIETLKTVNEYLYNLEAGINDIVNQIQQGNEIEGIKNIIPVLDGIDYVCKAIILTKDIHKDEISLDDLNSQLKEIIEAFENEDYILLGDLLNYELLPIINEIHEKIKISI